MQDATSTQRIAEKFELLAAMMDERMRRQWAAAEARAYGWGGIYVVSVATGMSPHTIRKGLGELNDRAINPGEPIPERLRAPGAGRKRCTESDSELQGALERLVDPVTRGDPQSPLRWTCKSTTQLANELTRQGHSVSPSTVGRLLRAAGYSLQSNRKTKEGADHPDRNAQFEHINATVRAFQKRGQPVISVDTKKKELIGNFKNGGREWRPKGEPEEVLVHDFMQKELGKAIPYGVYDVTENEGWVSVGIDHDTARLPRQRFSVGGRKWDRSGIAGPPSCSSWPMVVEATAVVVGCGSWHCTTCRLGWTCLFMFATSHLEPANGTRSNIACFAISRRTGVDAH
jgi:transposase